MAHLAFASGRFPGAVEMAAFNPFIPLNEDDSSIAAALFEIRVRNTEPAPGHDRPPPGQVCHTGAA